MSKQVEKNTASFYYSNYAIIDGDGNLVEEIRLPRFDKAEILSRGDFLATGTVYNKEALLNIGLYSEKVRNCGLENYELLLKMLNNNYSGELVEDSLFYYRRHASNLSEVRRVNIIEYGNGLFKELGLGKYTTNPNHPYKLII
jgi:hypothetical protein